MVAEFLSSDYHLTSLGVKKFVDVSMASIWIPAETTVAVTYEFLVVCTVAGILRVVPSDLMTKISGLKCCCTLAKNVVWAPADFS